MRDGESSAGMGRVEWPQTGEGNEWVARRLASVPQRRRTSVRARGGQQDGAFLVPSLTRRGNGVGRGSLCLCA
jgi:hypothetical protein